MTLLTLNGKSISHPLAQDRPFSELLGFVRKSYNSEAVLISSVRINGEEMSATDESRLADVPLSDMGQVEVFTSHPREVAEETLQGLRIFCGQLAQASRDVAALAGTKEFAERFQKLLSGIELFSDATQGVKRILRIGSMPETALIEAEFMSVLRDGLQAHQTADWAYLHDLLAKHLPENFEQWRDQALPAWIKSRDS